MKLRTILQILFDKSAFCNLYGDQADKFIRNPTEFEEITNYVK